MATATDVKERTKTTTKLKEPSKFKVIYLNDNITTQQFVIESLMIVFNHSVEEANRLMMQVHEEGAAVVAILPFEIAEQKGIEVTQSARASGFPLQIKLEPEC